MTLEIHHRTEAEVIASEGPVVFRIINGARTDVEDVARVFEIVDGILERQAAAGLFVAVEHGSPLPSAEVRRFVGERMPLYGERLVVGYALTGLGFWASAARLFTVGLAKLGRITTIIESSTEAIAERMALELVGLDGQALARRVEELRTQVGAEVQAGDVRG